MVRPREPHTYGDRGSRIKARHRARGKPRHRGDGLNGSNDREDAARRLRDGSARLLFGIACPGPAEGAGIDVKHVLEAVRRARLFAPMTRAQRKANARTRPASQHAGVLPEMDAERNRADANPERRGDGHRGVPDPQHEASVASDGRAGQRPAARQPGHRRTDLPAQHRNDRRNPRRPPEAQSRERHLGGTPPDDAPAGADAETASSERRPPIAQIIRQFIKNDRAALVQTARGVSRPTSGASRTAGGRRSSPCVST